MKNYYLLLTIFGLSLAKSQIPFPHNASNTSSAERIANFGVTGITNQRFEITNGTENSNEFLPAIWAHNGSTNYHALQLHATTTRNLDTGSNPLIKFIASVPSNLDINGTSYQFPWGNGGTQQSLSTRPTFAWLNGQNTVMILTANNYLGLGTESPTANFDVEGTARIRTLPVTGKIVCNVVSDLDGNLFMDASCKKRVSDSKYKDESKTETINNALEKIISINGIKLVDNATESQEYYLDTKTVEKSIPNLLKSDNIENGNYNEMIPILIEAIKEQQTQIAILNSKIEEFEKKSELNITKTSKSSYFSQNNPNPFSDISEVEIFIEPNIKEARLIVYNQTGEVKLNETISERGVSYKYNIKGNEFKSGIYFYTVITDGINLGTKKLIIK